MAKQKIPDDILENVVDIINKKYGFKWTHKNGITRDEGGKII